MNIYQSDKNSKLTELGCWAATSAANILINIGTFELIAEVVDLEFKQAPLISCAVLFGGVTGTINYVVHRAVWGTGAHRMSDAARKTWQTMTAVSSLVVSAALFVGLMELSGAGASDTIAELALKSVGTAFILAPSNFFAGYMLSHFNLHLKQD